MRQSKKLIHAFKAQLSKSAQKQNTKICKFRNPIAKPTFEQSRHSKSAHLRQRHEEYRAARTPELLNRKWHTRDRHFYTRKYLKKRPDKKNRRLAKSKKNGGGFQTSRVASSKINVTA